MVLLMDSLDIIKLYTETQDKKIKNFSDNIDSELRIISDYDKVDCNYEWLELIEDTIPYIDNILRSPNRFIVNEEDVIKIELAKRVTVESIKHLSKNTNLIQEYDKKTGDVRPSKILNITKEESYDTYENRLIYTLIVNMKLYIEQQKKNLVFESSIKNDKTFEYNGKTHLGNEKIGINMHLNSCFNSKKKEVNNEGLGIAERLEKLDINIAALTNSDVYKTIEKKHIALIIPPVKKTNLIMKNVNFQYAMKLWNFLHENRSDTTLRKKDKQDYIDNGKYKNLVDETFLLQFLILDSLNKTDGSKEAKEVLSEKIVNNMVSNIVDINNNITLDEIKDIVDKQYTIIKYKNVVSDKEIRKIFRDNINRYMDKIVNIKI